MASPMGQLASFVAVACAVVPPASRSTDGSSLAFAFESGLLSPTNASLFLDLVEEARAQLHISIITPPSHSPFYAWSYRGEHRRTWGRHHHIHGVYHTRHVTTPSLHNQVYFTTY